LRRIGRVHLPTEPKPIIRTLFLNSSIGRIIFFLFRFGQRLISFF